MTKEEYEDFVLRYKGCGACFPMYHTLSRAEKMWFTAIQKDVANLEKEYTELEKSCDETQELLDKQIEATYKLYKENTELKKLFADCDTCKRTCDIGNCCKFGSDYLPDVEKVLNEQKQLTKAKEIIRDLLSCLYSVEYDCISDLEEAEQFLNEVEK